MDTLRDVAMATVYPAGIRACVRVRLAYNVQMVCERVFVQCFTVLRQCHPSERTLL